MKCSLCGLEFDKNSNCTTCPFSKNCNTIHCPNCGYQMVDTENLKIVNWIKKIFKRKGLKEKKNGKDR